MENHHVWWTNQRTQWPFSIANCEFTRGYPLVERGFLRKGLRSQTVSWWKGVQKLTKPLVGSDNTIPCNRDGHKQPYGPIVGSAFSAILSLHLGRCVLQTMGFCRVLQSCIVAWDLQYKLIQTDDFCGFASAKWSQCININDGKWASFWMVSRFATAKQTRSCMLSSRQLSQHLRCQGWNIVVAMNITSTACATSHECEYAPPHPYPTPPQTCNVTSTACATSHECEYAPPHPNPTLPQPTTPNEWQKKSRQKKCYFIQLVTTRRNTTFFSPSGHWCMEGKLNKSCLARRKRTRDEIRCTRWAENSLSLTSNRPVEASMSLTFCAPALVPNNSCPSTGLTEAVRRSRKSRLAVKKETCAAPRIMMFKTSVKPKIKDYSF